MSSVSLQYDSFIQDKDHPIWILTLNNMENIFQDDRRYGDDDSAWLRAKSYVESNGLYVTNIGIKFRSNYVKLFSDLNNHVVFTKVIGRSAFCEEQEFLIQEPNMYYRLGAVNDCGNILMKKYKVPELIFESDENFASNCYYEENYIWHPNKPRLEVKQRHSV